MRSPASLRCVALMAEPALQDAVRRAFIYACEAELRTPKPGNVHIFAPGHRMRAEDFFQSARAAAEPLTRSGAGVGERIYNAVAATREKVGQNTNLGILLLCAPLAHAALNEAAGDLGQRSARVLQALDARDADFAFRAIALAGPAGLGAAPRHDVNAPARASLLEAMREAAPRDRIALQYATNFHDLYQTGGGVLREARAHGCDEAVMTLRLYLAFFAEFPDSHIARKFGNAAAEAAQAAARAKAGAFLSARRLLEIEADALRYDAELKASGLNPGTSADLTVAALFADCLSRILANACKNG
jgi:triphosphoribosyl-dephospho-CoA synthase